MRVDWIIIEIITILVESFVFVYFLNKRFQSKYDAKYLDLIALLVIVTGSLTSKFEGWPLYIYDLVLNVLLFTYLLALKEGSLLQKIFGIFMVYAVSIASSLIGAGLAALITNSTYQQSLETQAMTRFLALIFINMLQITVFYVLAKNHKSFRDLKKKPVLALCGMVFINFICLFLIWYYVQVPALDNQQHHTHQVLIWIATGLLLHLTALFAIYELFVSEEEKNINLQMDLQRVEFEKTFCREIDAMYTDIRNWRHDYNTNLTALRVLVEEKEMNKALEFIDHITYEPERLKRTLQTGNLILDAVVSSKLWLAQSKGIEVNLQLVFPGNSMHIDDHDFCAVIGNLLDNAIEACERMGKADGKRFIDFSLFVRGKNIVLTICNSFNGELKCSKNRYLSLKQDRSHGIGLKHVDSIVKKYNGQIVREIRGNIFDTCVVIPIFP